MKSTALKPFLSFVFVLAIFSPMLAWADPVAKIVLTADPVSIPADGNHSVSITATLSDRNGLIPTATDVTFKTDRGLFKNGLQTFTETSAGAITGDVIVSLRAVAGDSGIAQVTCEADGVKQYIAVIFEPAATITLKANPTWIPADGASSSSITATLTGSNQSPVPSGTQVTFTTDKGQFQNGKQTITQVTLASTSSSSSVTVSLIADTSTGVAHVTCSANGVTQQIEVAMGDIPTASITLSADPLMIPADGRSSSLITAKLMDPKGVPVAVGTSAIFTTNHGTFSNKAQSITLATTDSTGIIKVSLIAGTDNSIAEVVCTSFGVSQKIVIGIGSSIGAITLSATPLKIPADGVSSSAIGAKIVDQNNQLIAAGVSVRFETTLGKFSNGLKTIDVVTTVEYLISEINVMVSLIADTTPGKALVTCTSGGVTQAITVEIGDMPAATIKLSANPTKIPADGKSSSTITAIVADSGGKPVANGTAVNFTTTLGTFNNGKQALTEVISNNAGTVDVSLMSGTTSGIATVTCTSNGVTQAINVEIGNTQTPEVAGITLTANPTKIPADGTSSSLIKATLVDSAGQAAINGTSVTFTTTLGVFSNNTTTISATVSNGQGTVSVSLIAGKDSGIATIVCSSSGVSQSVTVQIGEGASDPVAGIILTAAPTKLPADGYSSSLITATLTNAAGLPVAAGTSVTFTTTLGTFSNKLSTITTATASTSGIVQTSLLAGTKSGIATVVCYSSGVSQAIQVQIGDAPLKPVAVINLTVSPEKIPADGSSSALIKATLQDSAGLPAGAGTLVTFTTTLGHFNNGNTSITLTVDGTAGTVSVSLIAGTTPGLATIVCTSNGVTQRIGLQIGELPAASISVSADPTTLYAGGSSTSIITATLIDSLGRAVAKGTIVKFRTTENLAVFSNGETQLTTSTQDDTGIVKVTLIAGTQTGLEKIECSSGNVSQSVHVQIINMQYELEPNDEMQGANWITFGDAFSAQLASPYDVDWYVFDMTQVGTIKINFITTAIPEGAGCEGKTSTVGTYRVDVRNAENNIIMSYQNVDCNLDNGYWKTGIKRPGMYYIVVYCPRLPSNAHYLSTPYYISLYKETNDLCTPNIRANGKDGYLAVTSSEPVTINVDMDAGKQKGLNADWWVVFSSPWGFYSLTNYGWVPGVYALAQYPLFSFEPVAIYNYYLSPGDYTFYFAVDVTPDNVFDSPFYYDSVQVHIYP